MEAKVDALDIKILKGTGPEVGRWAKQHGFRLPPDAPEGARLLRAAQRDLHGSRVRRRHRQREGPEHRRRHAHPPDDPDRPPLVPLRILGLGKSPTERVTPTSTCSPSGDRSRCRPRSPPSGQTGWRQPGLVREYDERASGQLLRDLHDDKSGDWVPLEGMWLTKIRVDSTAGALKYDLAIDASGAGAPSVQDAGFTLNGLPTPTLLAATRPTYGAR
jgi:hypothetical protein